MRTTRQQEPDAQLRALLVALYAHGPAAIVTTAATAGLERRTARRALRLGCAELVEHERLPRDRAEAGLRRIRLADLGRALLRLPEPAALNGRDPIEVLNEGIRMFMGAHAFPITACADGSTDPRMIATADYRVVDGWPDELEAAARYASEQGVVSCETISEHIRGDEWRLMGFAAGGAVSPRASVAPSSTSTPISPEVDSQVGLWAIDLDYIQAELEYIELRCRRIALERRRDLTPEERAQRRSGFNLDDDDVDPDILAERIDHTAACESALRVTIDARLALHRAHGPELALDRLVARHGLDDFERCVLLLAAGPCVSRRFEKLLAALEQEKQPLLTVDAVFSFCELSFAERIARRTQLSPRGRLVRSDLIEMTWGNRAPSPKDLLGTEIELRGRSFSYMLGDESIGDELAEIASVEAPLASFDRLVLPEIDKTRILRVIDGHDRYLRTRAEWGLDEVIAYGRGAILMFHGPSGTGKTHCAHACAARLGKRVMNVDIPTIAAHQEAARVLPGIFREARLQGALVFCDEAEGLFADRQLGNPLMALLLTELERFEGHAILATNSPAQLDPALARRILVDVAFVMPDVRAREKIWICLLPPKMPLAADVDLAALAEHQLSGGSIKNAILAASARAIHDAPPGTDIVVTHAMLHDAAQEQGDRSSWQEMARRRAGFGVGDS